jgi:hypothetical protein
MLVDTLEILDLVREKRQLKLKGVLTMPDHQHVGGSKNSNINVKRDNISKPKKSSGDKKNPPLYENFNGETIK